MRRTAPRSDPVDEHLPRLGAVRGAEHALALHLLDDAGRAVVADLQVALDEAGRRLALAADEGEFYRNPLWEVTLALACLATILVCLVAS